MYPCGIFDLTSATLSHNLHKQPRQSSSIALLFSFLLLHWLRSTRDPRRHTRLGSVGLQRTTCTTVPSEGERERERHMYTRTFTWRASSTLPFLAISTTWWKRWARPEPCLVSTSLANLHRQRSYGGRGAVRAGVWTTPLPRKASILPCAAKAAHYTPCCPTFAFPSPRRMTRFRKAEKKPDGYRGGRWDANF